MECDSEKESSLAAGSSWREKLSFRLHCHGNLFRDRGNFEGLLRMISFGRNFRKLNDKFVLFGWTCERSGF